MRGQFIGGHPSPTTVNPFGISVANAKLPGDGFCRHHDSGLKYVLRDIIRATRKPPSIAGAYSRKIIFVIFLDFGIGENYCLQPIIFAKNQNKKMTKIIFRL